VIGTIAAIGLIFFRPAAIAYYPYSFGFFPFGFFFAFFLVFFLLRWLFWPWRWGYSRHYWGWSYGDRAYYILRERYARGEITKDQYDQTMRDLQQHGQAV